MEIIVINLDEIPINDEAFLVSAKLESDPREHIYYFEGE